VLLDPATKSDYRFNGTKFIGGPGSPAIFNASDMQATLGTVSGPAIGVGTFNNIPTIQSSGTGSSYNLNINPLLGRTNISVNSSGNGVVKLGGVITVLKNVTIPVTLNADTTSVCIDAGVVVDLSNIEHTGVHAGRCLFISQSLTGLGASLTTGVGGPSLIISGVGLSPCQTVSTGFHFKL